MKKRKYEKKQKWIVVPETWEEFETQKELEEYIQKNKDEKDQPLFFKATELKPALRV